MINKKYQATDKLQVCFTPRQAMFLTEQKQETGDTKSDIVRHAVQEYMNKIIDKKLEKKNEK